MMSPFSSSASDEVTPSRDLGVTLPGPDPARGRAHARAPLCSAFSSNI
jgi:hypothetical protein